ncbi:hypothetical protein HDC94_000313 [Leifsonia sp. AK011]|uniref:hypothetical protein n=1 Tax=Leifsonia sp. AK011 TaxID=2723075 RepID=UPI0015CB6000|nr:hypothetical protein [Leifsonia sp. AK011]NYF09157.1 hypothetical protein [Leifsonia sp. AK011]
MNPTATNRRDTPQTLDPLGGFSARYFTIASTLLAVAMAVYVQFTASQNVVAPLLEGGALLAFAAAAVVNVTGAAPHNFPYSARRHAALQTLMVLAFALDCASRHPDGEGTWASIALMLMLVTIGAFRPAAEIAVFTLLSATAIALISWACVGNGRLVESDVVPLIAVGMGATAFSRILVTRMQRWQQAYTLQIETERASIRAREHAEALTRRSELVEVQVGPYLEEILNSPTLTEVDITRARDLAATLRTMLSRSSRFSWLAELVDTVGPDPTRLLDVMSAAQRRALAAVIGEIRNAPGTVAGSTMATFTPDPTPTLRVTAGLDGERRHGLRPAAYRAVLSSVFASATVDLSPTAVVIGVDLTPTNDDRTRSRLGRLLAR